MQLWRVLLAGPRLFHVCGLFETIKPLSIYEGKRQKSKRPQTLFSHQYKEQFLYAHAPPYTPPPTYIPSVLYAGKQKLNESLSSRSFQRLVLDSTLGAGEHIAPPPKTPSTSFGRWEMRCGSLWTVLAGIENVSRPADRADTTPCYGLDICSHFIFQREARV